MTRKQKGHWSFHSPYLRSPPSLSLSSPHTALSFRLLFLTSFYAPFPVPLTSPHVPAPPA